MGNSVTADYRSYWSHRIEAMSRSPEARKRLLSYLGLAVLVVLVAIVVAYNAELPGWESPIVMPKLGGAK